MAFTKKGGLHRWAAHAIVSAQTAEALVRAALSRPQVVIQALREQPTLLSGVRREVQTDMYRQLAKHGLQVEMAELAACKRTPALARSLLADVVLAAPSDLMQVAK